MDISKIDKNFKINNTDIENSSIIKLPDKRVNFTGGFYDKSYGFIKMPIDYANSINSMITWGMRCGAGMKIMFSTNSKTLKIKAKLYAKCLMQHMAPCGSAGFTLNEVINGKEIFHNNFYPEILNDNASLIGSTILDDSKMHNYILYFPLYSGVEELSLEIEKNSKIKPYNYYKNTLPIIYYGSSITQGGCAGKPNNCYQTYVSEKTRVDYKIFGISGNAKGEPEMAKYIANEDCSIFVLDYDYNAPSVEHLKNTHLPFYKEFRSVLKNKNTPIIIMSKPDGFRTGNEERKAIILDTYNYAIKHNDKNVFFIDGNTIYPKSIREHCYVDGCHPNDLGFYYMAKAILKIINKYKLL